MYIVYIEENREIWMETWSVGFGHIKDFEAPNTDKYSSTMNTRTSQRQRYRQMHRMAKNEKKGDSLKKKMNP